MQIKQFEDKSLAHFSYAILSDCTKKIALIDPSRNPALYLDFAKENDAEIEIVIETHPHADFISSHLELHQTTGATIYTSKLVGATYPHKNFDKGDHLQMGNIKLSAINTPGHSPDSICIILEHDDIQKAVFTGDTLFIGDCGRPDLREEEGELSSGRFELGKQMYHSLLNKLMVLSDDTIVYPAHGAGTLCGKALSKASSSTIGKEKATNWCLQAQTEDEFVKELLKDQPFIPAYFPFDVALNKKGAPAFKTSVDVISIEQMSDVITLDNTIWIIDIRKENIYKEGHLPKSINLMEGDKMETWLGSMIQPNEAFYLIGDNATSLKTIIERVAAIGYEPQIKGAFILQNGEIKSNKIDIASFNANLGQYTIIDVRNEEEVNKNKIFADSLSFPLGQLRENAGKIPTNKPIVVHCAGGYRSAAASSFLQSELKNNVKVFDLGEAVKLH